MKPGDAADPYLAQIRGWKDCRWDTKTFEGAIRLIVHHPATHGDMVSPEKRATTPAEIEQAKEELVRWANAEAGRRGWR